MFWHYTYATYTRSLRRIAGTDPRMQYYYDYDNFNQARAKAYDWLYPN